MIKNKFFRLKGFAVVSPLNSDSLYKRYIHTKYDLWILYLKKKFTSMDLLY